jgi:hypothetical protein
MIQILVQAEKALATTENNALAAHKARKINRERTHRYHAWELAFRVEDIDPAALRSADIPQFLVNRPAACEASAERLVNTGK